MNHPLVPRRKPAGKLIINAIRSLSTGLSMLYRRDIQQIGDVLNEYEHRLSTSTHPMQLPSILSLIALEQLHLLLTERALAYPTREGNWKIVAVPDLTPMRRIPVLSERIGTTRHGSSEHVEILSDIYTYDGFVGVKPGDIVVDIGAYVGGFTFFAATEAALVVAIDPIESETQVLSANTRNLDNVRVIDAAAWNKPKTLEIRTSSYPNDNSVLPPDAYDTGDSFQVYADTVPNLVREVGVESIDYLKVEAEGAEPEILKGAMDSDMQIRKVAVDASEERNGAPVVDPVMDLLEQHGYECRVKTEEAPWHGNSIVFGRQS